MQPIMRLHKHQRLRAIRNVVRNFVAAMRRQAMHHNRIRRRVSQQSGVQLIGCEKIMPALGAPFALSRWVLCLAVPIAMGALARLFWRAGAV